MHFADRNWNLMYSYKEGVTRQFVITDEAIPQMRYSDPLRYENTHPGTPWEPHTADAIDEQYTHAALANGAHLNATGGPRYEDLFFFYK